MDSMAPIARADTARTEASDTSPPVTGSDGRGLGVVASAGAGASRVSPVRTVSPTRMGATPAHAPRHRHTGWTPGKHGHPPRTARRTRTTQAVRAVRYIGAPCASNAPAPILNVPFIAGISQVASNRWLSSSVGTSPPDGLYASSLEGLSGSPDHHTLTVAYGRSAANSYSSLPAYWP